VNVNLNLCAGCLEKQQHLDRLEEENQRLRQQLRRQQRQVQEGPFGSSTPSAKIPLKANTPEEERSKPGGACRNHAGHGRPAADAATADRVEEVGVGPSCPHCGGPLEKKGFRDRGVLDSRPMRAERIVYRLEKTYCRRCKKTVQARAPGVLEKSLVGNQLITQVVMLHYRHGIPMGRICAQTGLGLGTVIAILHRLAALFGGLQEKLIGEYRQAPVRHADETGWRTDGHGGYAWLFATPELSLFLFRATRSARVVREVLGEQPLKGVLVVDRYAGYNRAPCAIQYCYAHLLRDVEDLGKEFPDHAEVQAFTDALIPLLSQAMHLHSRPLSDARYSEEAKPIQQQIVEVTQQPARHLGVRQVQDIFRDNAHRLYHWVENRNVPADNNRAERELRPTVIARKVSFGSQSDAGAKTRGVLMSLMHTLAKRVSDVESHFKSVLDKLADDPGQDPLALLFPPDTS